MTFTPFDPDIWPRKEAFYYFGTMAPTSYSLTVEIDITSLHDALKRAERRFFPTYLWLVTKCLNRQPECKTAVKDGKVGFYDTLTPLYAVFHEDDKTFSLMWTEFDANYDTFYDRYRENQDRYGSNHGILAQPHALPPENAYTISCVPWISFDHFAVHTHDNKPYYFPSVEAGKFYKSPEGRIVLPLSLTCHHAATDGYHINKFLGHLGEEMSALCRQL